MNSKVPVFILAGGLGTRLSEETHLKPKPMIEIGEHPILLHIMRWYYGFGFNDFVVCAGYRSWEIKQYFLTYQFRTNHLMIDHRTAVDKAPEKIGTNEAQEKWRVRVIDTGVECMTGARVARAFDVISETQEIEDFAVTYGDGVSDVDLSQEFGFHQKHGRLGTVLGVSPIARFGELDISSSGQVQRFAEKPQSSQGLINGGFFFFKKAFREYLSSDADFVLESNALTKLASDGQMMTYTHEGFWRPMDTLRDKNLLQELWDSGKAPWKR